MSPVTYVCPELTRSSGCSETLAFGMIQETAGSLAVEADRWHEQRFAKYLARPGLWVVLDGAPIGRGRREAVRGGICVTVT